MKKKDLSHSFEMTMEGRRTAVGNETPLEDPKSVISSAREKSRFESLRGRPIPRLLEIVVRDDNSEWGNAASFALNPA